MRFRRKVTLWIILAEAGLICTLAGIFYPRLVHEQQEALRRKVLSIAATAALSISGDVHQTIEPNPNSIASPAYQKLQTQLKQILAVNPGIRYVWTMVRSDKPNQTLFVGDVGGGGIKTPGRPYDAGDIPDLWKGFHYPSADVRPVRDPWGVSLSGYAPIRSSDGKVVAIVGVDIYDQQIFILRREILEFLIFALALACLIGLALGAVVARQIARPLYRLMRGMRRVEAGRLQERIDLKTNDEFENLASSFNKMTLGLRTSREQIRAAFLKAIQSLISALEAKDPYTRGHSVSVSRYAVEIAQAMAKSSKEIESISQLATLHDIGKIGIQDAMLHKTGTLTPEERRSMQQHPLIGAKILAPLELSQEELSLILCHHEREDGTGYPQGLERSQIPDLVAIVVVADAYDAMTSHRPYRKALKPQEALSELRSKAGTQFRPEMVEALAIVLEKKGLL